MAQTSRYARGAFTFLVLAAISVPSFAASVVVPASAQWVDTGLDVTANGRIAVAANGSWSNGGASPQMITSAGFAGLTLTGTLVPGAPLGSLVGRVGSTTFAIGDAKIVRAPASGRLFLSMNDNPGDFADNTGELRVSIELNPLLPGIHVIQTPPDFIPADQLIGILKNIVLAGGRIQISQTGNGQTISIPNPPGLPRPVTSYVAFGPYLEGTGLGAFALDVPVEEIAPDEVVNTGGATLFVEWFLSHSTVFVHQVRFLANNIHSNFDENLSVRLGEGEVVLDIAMPSDDPTIRGEGEGYTFIPFGIPIPLGWEDGLCPDIMVDNLRAVVHFRPTVDKGKIIVPPPTVELVGEPRVSIADFLFDGIKKTMMAEFQTKLQNELAKPSIRTSLGNSLQQLVMKQGTGKTVSAIVIDGEGLAVLYK